MRKLKNIAIFLVILWNREAVATKKFIFSLFGGIKIDFREGNRVLGGQPMGILILFIIIFYNYIFLGKS